MQETLTLHEGGRLGLGVPSDPAYRQIGFRIRVARDAIGLSQEAVAELLGVSGATYSRYESGKVRIPASDLIHLARVLGSTAAYLLGETGRPAGVRSLPGISSVVLVPIVGEVSAGSGFLPPEGYVALTPPRDASPNLVSFKVRGECMGPRIEPGDSVIVDLAKSWKDGAIVLARVDSELVVKRAHREDGHIRLSADSPGYADIVSGDVEVYGPVIRIEKTPE